MRRKFITLGIVLTLLSFVVVNSQQGSASLNSNLTEKSNTSSKILSNEDLANIVGGVDISDILEWTDTAISAVCVGTGLWAVFARKVNPYLAAFCAGWALGKLIDSLIH